MPTKLDLDAAITAINDATNAEAAKVDEVVAEVAAVATEVDSLKTQLAAAGVDQASIDRLTKIGAALAGSTGKLGPVSDQLKAIASDPANPVPTPAPAPTPA